MLPTSTDAQLPATPRNRLELLDLARAVALLAMASYHFTWDLEFFGYAPMGMTAIGGWKLYARCIASSFLFMVGVSLFLAHANGIRWPGFRRRLAMVAGAALAISIVTYVAVPNGFIFFGILHQIALASVLGLAFLRLPALLTLIVAAAVVALPFYVQHPFFDHPALWWVGLSETRPRSNDYVPLFPWFGAVLAGLALAKLAASTGIVTKLSTIRLGRWAKWPMFAGRHSLAFYLIHQPVMIACVWLYAQVSPARVDPPDVAFRYQCEATCQQTRDTAFCAGYCGCMLDELAKTGDLKKLFAGDQDAALKQSIGDTAGYCTATIENPLPEEPTP